MGLFRRRKPTSSGKTEPSATLKRTGQPDGTKQSVRVDLWNMAGTAIIVPHPCGVFYKNQVGGYSCSHCELEGILVPLTTGGSGSQNLSNTCPLAIELFDYFFKGSKWKGHCYRGLDEETADHLDALFQKYKSTSFLRVDRTLLSKSKEAWIHVTLHFPDAGLSLFSVSSKTAILTWPNSD